MKKRAVTLLLKYGITAAVGALMVFAVLELHGFAQAESAMEQYRILSDAFTIPGVVLMMCGILVYISNEGAFEGISYALQYSLKMLIPGGYRDHETYRDFVERKREKGGVKGYGFLAITGAVFFAIALVFIALFYSEYRA